jgi:hypothetical protein
MAAKKINTNPNVDAILKEIVLGKIKQNRRLSKDEHWFYLTKILKMGDEEAEKVISKQKT